MGDRNSQWSTREYAAAVALASIVVFVVQYAARGLDDNRLTSWQWAFSVVDAARLFFWLAGGIAAGMAVMKPLARLRPSNVFLFLLSFLSSMVFWGEPEVIVDASRYFTQAKHLELYGLRHFVGSWGREIGAWTDMPLVPFLYGVIFKLFGEARIWIQVFNSLLFSGSVVLTAMMGKELWDRETGFHAGLLLLGMPYLYTQVPLMLVDIPSMFLLVMTLYLFLRALREGRGMILAAAAGLAATAYAKYSTWLMLSAAAVIAAVEVRRVWPSVPERRRLLRNCFGVLLGALVLGGSVFLYKADVFFGQMALLNSYQRPGLQRWGESLVSTFLFQINPLVTAAALAGAYAAARRRDASFFIVSWLLIVVVVLQIRRIRYIIMVFPMLALMASYGAGLIRDGALRRFFAVCVVVSSLVVAAGAFLPFLKGYSAANLAEAGRYLDALPEPVVCVYTPMPEDPPLNPAVAVPLLDMFTRKSIIYEYDPLAFSQPFEKIATSALRFTWEYRNPRYYSAADDKRDCAVVVISALGDAVLPPELAGGLAGYREAISYGSSEGIFSNQTYVKIYRKNKVFD